MNHLIEISQLSLAQTEQLLERAFYFKHNKVITGLTDHCMATLFYEDSTRTRVSFELAAKRLAMPVINIDLANSSENKGETIEDTLATLAAMGIDLFVIRHRQDGIQQHLVPSVGENGHIINAGDGKHAHPSQALLDLMTILENKPDLPRLKIAIVGDLRHSRVANSLQCLFKLVGVKELMLVAPEIWQPEVVHYGTVTNSLQQGLADADVVITLRVQRERLVEGEHLDWQEYRSNYALTASSLAYAKPDAIVMHPGPINRGVEIDSDVADGKASRILQQVNNGVFMRMAIIEALST
ncbi:aspartate carbamoyltransferase catalytic subunit [Legionella dresdenensis]|uniref:Aspartate carbamoyltransferase n=1 Tax=Legionella dresdenensis TaxID=450200 RepID=A0ABV8CFA7_9GAMM